MSRFIYNELEKKSPAGTGARERFVKRRKHHSTSSAESLPPQDRFMVRDIETLSALSVRKGECLGIYESHGNGGLKLVCKSSSPKRLYLDAKRLNSRLQHLLIVYRAKSKGDLPLEIPPKPEDRFSMLRRHAFEAVAEARRILRLELSLTTPSEKEKAQEFLQEIAKDARRGGKSRGRKPSQKHNRRMIEVFKKLLRPHEAKLGKTKDAIPMGSSDPVDSMAKRLRTEMRRFAVRVYEARRFTISGKELYGFTSSEWPLIEKISALGAQYVSRKQKRQEAKGSTFLS